MVIAGQMSNISLRHSFAQAKVMGFDDGSVGVG
eukprot:TsM_000241000 transcript=TsM_000241000 gene=TsM_000241000